MDKLIAYCGLDCEKSEARIATVSHDESLREKVARLAACPVSPDGRALVGEIGCIAPEPRL